LIEIVEEVDPPCLSTVEEQRGKEIETLYVFVSIQLANVEANEEATENGEDGVNLIGGHFSLSRSLECREAVVDGASTSM